MTLWQKPVHTAVISDSLSQHERGEDMRKALIAIMMLLIVCSVFAGDIRDLDSETKVISAYKLASIDDVESQMLTLRMMDVNSAEFEENEIVVTPMDARDTDYPTYYWVLGGNIFGQVSLSFSFGPMWQNGLESSGKYIPYQMTLTHVSSKVGNSVLACNKSSVSLPVTFMGYDFRYADSVSYPATVSVSNTAKTATVTYNMNTSYTTIEKNGSPANYPYDVCSYWNRMGLATIHLQIDENGVPTGSSTQLPDGMYYSNIAITITAGT